MSRKRLSSAQLTVQILQQMQNTNQSLRIALSRARRSHEPRNTRLWGEVHAWVMEIQKHQITIDHIERVITGKKVTIQNSIKPFIDLATYWRYWGRRKGEKVTFITKKLFKQEKQREPRWLQHFFNSLEKKSLHEILEQVTGEEEKWKLQHSLPAILYTKLINLYTSDDLDRLGRYFNQPAPRYFWLNTLRSLSDELDHKLAGIRYSASPAVNGSYRLKKGRPLQHSGLYNQGKILLQDIAATAVTQLLPLFTGMQIIDACAALGNKTIQLLAREPGINITAGDLPGSRYSLLVQRVGFLAGKKVKPPFNDTVDIDIQDKQSSIRLTTWDARELPFDDFFADAIFIDAPCSGTGTLGTKPDVRADINREFIEKHVELQKSILQEAGRVVKTNGRIMYITCSLLPEENEEIIKNFLEKENRWKIEPLDHPLAEQSKLLSGTLRFFPPKSKSEGFFACLLQNSV